MQQYDCALLLVLKQETQHCAYKNELNNTFFFFNEKKDTFFSLDYL